MSKTPESSILGQVAASRTGGGDDLLVMTAVRGSDKTPNVGMHLYRVTPATGEVKWHAYNGGTVDTRQVLRNVLGEKVNGPHYLDQAKGVLLATDGRGVRLYDWDGGKERWAVDGSVKKLRRIYDLDTHDESSGIYQTAKGSLLVAHYGNDVSVVDVAAGRVLFAAEKADVVKVVPSVKLLITLDGNKLATYQLP